MKYIFFCLYFKKNLITKEWKATEEKTQGFKQKKPHATCTYVLHIHPSPSNHLTKMFSRQMVFSLS